MLPSTYTTRDDIVNTLDTNRHVKMFTLYSELSTVDNTKGSMIEEFIDHMTTRTPTFNIYDKLNVDGRSFRINEYLATDDDSTSRILHCMRRYISLAHGTVITNALNEWADNTSILDIRTLCSLKFKSYNGWRNKGGVVTLHIDYNKFIRKLLYATGVGNVIVAKAVWTRALLPSTTSTSHRMPCVKKEGPPYYFQPCINMYMDRVACGPTSSPRIGVPRATISWLLLHFKNPLLALDVHRSKNIASDAAESMAIAELLPLPTVLTNICQSYIMYFKPHEWMLSVLDEDDDTKCNTRNHKRYGYTDASRSTERVYRTHRRKPFYCI